VSDPEEVEPKGAMPGKTDSAATVDRDTTAASNARVGRRFAGAFGVAIVLCLAIVAITLEAMGVASRRVPAHRRLVAARNARELIAAWDDSGVHGALVVDVTRDLGYSPVNTGGGLGGMGPPVQTSTAVGGAQASIPSSVDAAGLPMSLGWPIRPVDYPARFRSMVDRRSSMWVAARIGIARSVTYVVGATEFAEKVRVGRESGFPGIADDGRSITANDEGYLRFVSAAFPAHAPPAAVLNIDASYFVSGTPQELMSALGDSLDEYALVTVNRAEDATDVPEPARVRLDEAAGLLSERMSP
jgi:hypothetical protein